MLKHRHFHSWGLFVLVAALPVQAEDPATGATPTPAAVPTPPAPPTTGTINVEVLGARSASGMVRCALFDKEDGFPTKAEKAIEKVQAPIKDKKAVCVFPGKAAGTYAVSAIHDENDNGKLETNFLGIPKEGVAATNDAKGRMGPPSFKDAQFKHDGRDNTLRMTLGY